MTPHAILGLHFNATREEVIAAYRRLAKTCHPDLNPDDPDATRRFTEIAEAYRTIIEDFDAHSRPRTGGADTGRKPTKVTLRRTVVLTVHEAMTGCRKSVNGVSGPCAGCEGTGRVPSGAPVECASCAGTGVRQRHQRGFINIRIACADCDGTGKVTWFTCHECSGYGSVHMESCDVDIPPATRDGDELVIPGGADDPERNTTGDVEILVSVRDPSFRMNGNDIETWVVVEVWDAALGTRIQARLPSGESCSLAIPSGTQNGARFRIIGRGLHYTEEKGDFVVVVKVRTPNVSDARIKESMEHLRSLYDRRLTQ